MELGRDAPRLGPSASHAPAPEARSRSGEPASRKRQTGSRAPLPASPRLLLAGSCESDAAALRPAPGAKVGELEPGLGPGPAQLSGAGALRAAADAHLGTRHSWTGRGRPPSSADCGRMGTQPRRGGRRAAPSLSPPALSSQSQRGREGPGAGLTSQGSRGRCRCAQPDVHSQNGGIGEEGARLSLGSDGGEGTHAWRAGVDGRSRGKTGCKGCRLQTAEAPGSSVWAGLWPCLVHCCIFAPRAKAPE